MSLTNQAETDLLTLYFINTQAPNIGDAGGLQPSVTPGSFYVSLHTIALTDADTTPVTNEAAYTGYARVAVARSAAGWTVAGDTPTTVDNDAAITFGECTAGSETLVHFGLTGISAGTYLLVHGDLLADLAVSAGITPEYAAGAFNITLD